MCQVKGSCERSYLGKSSPFRCWGSMTFNPLNLGTFHWSRFRLGFDVARTGGYVCAVLCGCVRTRRRIKACKCGLSLRLR